MIIPNNFTSILFLSKNMLIAGITTLEVNNNYVLF